MMHAILKTRTTWICISTALGMAAAYTLITYRLASVYNKMYFSEFYSLYIIAVIIAHQTVPFSILKMNASVIRMKGWRDAMNRCYRCCLLMSIGYGLAGYLNLVLVGHSSFHSLMEYLWCLEQILLWSCFYTSIAHFLLRVTGRWMLSAGTTVGLAVFIHVTYRFSAVSMQNAMETTSLYGYRYAAWILVLFLGLSILTCLLQPNERIAGGDNE